MDFNHVAGEFIKYYYQIFDSRRDALLSLYRETSLLTFESSQIVGAAAIIEKLTTLAFQKVKHEIITQDAQPLDSGIVVMVTGKLEVDDSQSLNFSQTFVLRPDNGSYYVAHDIFKLVYG